jgi:hypothetical protein
MLRMIKVPAKAEAMVHLLLNLAEDECVKTTASRACQFQAADYLSATAATFRRLKGKRSQHTMG